MERFAGLFQDEDVMDIIKCGGQIRVGNLILHLPPRFGFCGGVINAVRTLEAVLDESPNRSVWLLGELIHNQTVNTVFEKVGVNILPTNDIYAIFDHADTEDIVVIPAFGIPKDLESRLREVFSDEKIFDTTCRYIKQVWDFVEEMASQRRTIIIYGDPQHAETVATVSRALGADNAVVHLPSIKLAEQLIEALRRKNLSNYPQHLILERSKVDFDYLAFAEQTTKLYNETVEIQQRLDALAKDENRDINCGSTICMATQQRQDAAEKTCRSNCDIIIVVGGFSSSNTTQLYRIAAKYSTAYFVDNASAVEADVIRHYIPDQKQEVETRDWLSQGVRNIAILAGASCPTSDIGQTLRKLRGIALSLV